MKRSEAARYARWSAATACLLALLTLGVYLDRKWVAHREREKAPPPAPAGVTRQESKLTFSKGLGAQNIFTVEASKATNFRDNGASLLEDVKITIFGKTGARHDVIHTHRCEYEKDGQSIVCSGEVQLDLESAEDAERVQKNRGTAAEKVRVETRGVTFNRETGIAKSDQPVEFVFPNGQGQAIGVEYRSEEGAVRLLRDVSFLLVPGNATQESKTPGMNVREPVRVKASSADFERDSRVMHLRGQVEARTATARLHAGEIRLSLDKTFRAERLVAAAGDDGKEPELESHEKDDEMHLSGKTFTVSFTPEGSLATMEAAGGVKGSRENGKDADDFSADRASMDLWPQLNQPKDLNLRGDVQLRSKKGKTRESRTLETNALLVEFAERKKGESSVPERAETLARGTLEWTDTVAPPTTSASPAEAGPAQTKLTADKLELTFDSNGRANQLLASGNVVTDRALPGKAVESATAQNGSAQLLGSGDWSQIELQGDVRLKEGDRRAQGDRVVFVRSAQTATLTGNALARDASTETRAPRITFVQSSGEIRADGSVQSSNFAVRGTSPQLAATPANISADTLRANSKTGRALYTGHARLWQGDSVLEADSIELLRDAKTLNASGNVRAVFPQSPGPGVTPARALTVQQRTPNKVKLWHITAGTLTYNEAENRAHLGKNVVAQSAEQEIRAPQMDLYFTRSEKGAAGPGGATASATAPAGAQQISRAVATGGVTVVQGTRTATAERGEYSAVDGKFVMTGGNPTIFDASEGTTSGRQLTFFLADDTIIVDSEKGSRTLTKHRVEK
ncbi:MAG TPA: LPS export ABC transporter periplasmic protein LptC [Candidatus Sulfotelmatobacter sp.]|nr:LPS export ABC transporter periplasmic protein LptC [Candidatus Sulfotelmatobacter sp.]